MVIFYKFDFKKNVIIDYNYIVYNEIYLLNIFGKYMKEKFLILLDYLFIFFKIC